MQPICLMPAPCWIPEFSPGLIKGSVEGHSKANAQTVPPAAPPPMPSSMEQLWPGMEVLLSSFIPPLDGVSVCCLPPLALETNNQEKYLL